MEGAVVCAVGEGEDSRANRTLSTVPPSAGAGEQCGGGKGLGSYWSLTQPCKARHSQLPTHTVTPTDTQDPGCPDISADRARRSHLLRTTGGAFQTPDETRIRPAAPRSSTTLRRAASQWCCHIKQKSGKERTGSLPRTKGLKSSRFF